jgi:hypothetical protein
MAGMTGTFVCYEPTDEPNWLVEWDGIDCGHDGNGLCGVTPDGTGWFVDRENIDCLDDECPDVTGC